MNQFQSQGNYLLAPNNIQSQSRSFLLNPAIVDRVNQFYQMIKENPQVGLQVLNNYSQGFNGLPEGIVPSNTRGSSSLGSNL